MKKVFTVLAITVLVCASVFAGNCLSFRAHGSTFPFLLNIPMIGEDFIDVNADVEIDYYPSDNFRVGVEVDANFPIIRNEEVEIAKIAKELLAKGFAFAKIGYVANISETFNFGVDAGFGGCLFAGTTCMAATLQLTGAFRLSDNFSLEAGVKANAVIESKNMLPIWYPMIGAELKF